MRCLRAGDGPLADAAVPIAAAERGFAEDEKLCLKRDPRSGLGRRARWAHLRHVRRGRMLAPFAIATSLGLSLICASAPRFPATALRSGLAASSMRAHNF